MRSHPKKLRRTAFLAVFILLFLLFPFGSAAAEARYLYFDGHGTLLLHKKDGEQYISLYGSALYLGGTGVYDGRTREMRVTVQDRTIRARDGEEYVLSNGRRIEGARSYIESGVFYIPLRSLADALDKDLTRSGNRYYLTEKAVGGQTETQIDPDCVLWLARIIYCESRGQPFEGQVAVGSVVMNRVDSPEFPNTIFSVIFDRKYGVQFTPAGNGSVWCTPDETSIRAAKTVLSGYRTDRGILYFMNADLATSTWIRDNRRFAFKIGDHSFYY